MLAIHLNFACNSLGTNYSNETDSIKVVIQNWAIFNTDNSDIQDNEIRSLAVDNQNNLWVGTFNKGIARFNGYEWIEYDTSNSELSDNSIWCISVDDNNNIWIGTANGLTKFDHKNWTVYNSSNSPLPYKVILSMAVDKNNILWIGCGHYSAGGILSFNEGKWSVYNTENSPLPSSIINTIYVDEKNTKWIGTPKGLLKIDNHDRWNVYTKQNSGLLFGVNAIATDFNNNLWIGANELTHLALGYYYGGLQKYDGQNWFDFRPHPKGEYNPNAIVSNRVDHIICDRFNNLLIATETEWKYPYNLSFFKNGVWINITDLKEEIPHNLFVRDIKIDKNNTVWLATQLGVVSFNYSLTK